jgi:hypothetical protein
LPKSAIDPGEVVQPGGGPWMVGTQRRFGDPQRPFQEREGFVGLSEGAVGEGEVVQPDSGGLGGAAALRPGLGCAAGGRRGRVGAGCP